MNINLSTRVNQPFLKVKEGFTEDLFESLNPPFPPVKLIRFDGSSTGDIVSLELNFIFFKQVWTSEITENHVDNKEFYFVDEGRKLPFFLRTWRHKHRMVSQGTNQSLIIDEISYRAPNIVLELLLFPVLYAQFAMRKPVYKKYFGRNKPI